MATPLLYHWEPNANSGKPILTLEEKGVAFDSHYLDLLSFDQHAPEYLAINPMGTIPAMVHDGHLLNESTAIMEYIDAAFEGPALRPADPEERWRMRWWMKFLDQYYCPAISMIGWSIGIGPLVRQRDPAELERRIAAIPLKERRDSWSKAIHGTFTPEELAESRRRVEFSAQLFERHLAKHTWLAGESYSLADINAFSSLYAMPGWSERLNVQAIGEDITPRTMAWLRRIYQRPAVRRAWSHGRRVVTYDLLKHLEAV